MSAARTQLDEVIARVQAVLDLTSVTWLEHPRAFELDSLGQTHLTNRFSALYGDASEDIGQKLSQLVITRPVVINLTYKTFSAAVDDKTDTVYTTVLENEEDIILDLRMAALTDGRIMQMESATVETFLADGDNFLINTITMQTFYNVTS